ncbi:unnamed protein product [Linum trigynum]|uniref:Uncharacterized protein n=1 Tax=Linum trigynum TaxID=586398 RepID=A0AAV2ETW6_9ROSI
MSSKGPMPARKKGTEGRGRKVNGDSHSDMVNAPRSVKRNRRPRRNQPSHSSRNSPVIAKEVDPARRRRMILQDESEEEFVVHEPPMQAHLLGPLGKGDLGPTKSQDMRSTPSVEIAEQKGYDSDQPIPAKKADTNIPQPPPSTGGVDAS